MNNRIRELRRSLGLTQKAFAEKTAMVQTTVSAVEKGTRALTRQQILTICAVFSVSEVWLRTGEGDMFVSSPPAASMREEIAAAFADFLGKVPDDAIFAFFSNAARVCERENREKKDEE